MIIISIMNHIIRKATEADIDAVYAIELEGHARWNRRQFADELGLTFSRFYVIEEEGIIIGFAVAWIVADEIQLNDIGISTKRRLRGMGTRLLDHIIADASAKHRPVKFFLEVSVRNTVARAFYRDYGFTETGRRLNYYDNTDAIIMEKEIVQ